MQQLELVVGEGRDHTLARSSDPTTSHQGDADVRRREGPTQTIKKNKHRHRALECFALRGPLIPRETVYLTGVDGMWKRVSELEPQGFIAKTGRIKHLPRGEYGHEYEITDAGRAAYAALGPTSYSLTNNY